MPDYREFGMDHWIWQQTELSLNFGFADFWLCKLEAVVQFCRSVASLSYQATTTMPMVTGRYPRALQFSSRSLLWNGIELSVHSSVTISWRLWQSHVKADPRTHV